MKMSERFLWVPGFVVLLLTAFTFPHDMPLSITFETTISHAKMAFLNAVALSVAAGINFFIFLDFWFLFHDRFISRNKQALADLILSLVRKFLTG